MGAGAGVGEWGGGSVYLSIHPRRYMYCTCTVHCTQRSVESEHLFFWRGSFFFAFFFLDRVGELAAAEEKVFWFFLYLFFGGGVFGTAAAAGFYLALSLFLFLSLFLSRSGEFEEGLEDGREEREERKAV